MRQPAVRQMRGTAHLPRPLLQLRGIGAEIRDTNRAGSVLVALELDGRPAAGALIRHDGTLWRLAPAGDGAGDEHPRPLV